MSVWVVDTSVAVKWFIAEEHTQASISLLNDKHQLWVPDLFISEFGNALWKKHLLGQVSTDEAHAILTALLKSPIKIHPSQELIDAALDIAFNTGRSIYDSLFLSLAVRLSATMVTADRRYQKAILATPFSKYIVFVEDIQ